MSRSAALLRTATPATAPPVLGQLLARGPVVQRSCAACGAGKNEESKCPTCEEAHALAPVQAKLTIGAPDDPLEKEADEVADKVMRMPAAAPPPIAAQKGGDHELRRQAAAAGHDMPAPCFAAGLAQGPGDASADALARSLDARALAHGPNIYFVNGQYDPRSNRGRHVLAHEPTHVLQQGSVARKPAPRKGLVPTARDSSGEVAPHSVRQVLSRAGQPMEPDVRILFQSRFGRDFGNVRLHTDAEAAASARAVNAQAYAVGNHIVFGAARYSPTTGAGGRLLAHELAHVVQSNTTLRRSSVSPIPEGEGHRSDDDEPVQRLLRQPDTTRTDEPSPTPEVARQGSEAVAGAGAATGPSECTPSTPPGWDSFTGPVPRSSTWGALTSYALRTVRAGAKTRFQGVFNANRSWVKPRSRFADDPARNGSAAVINSCRAYFAGAPGGGHWALEPTQGCAASPNPRGDKATNEAECTTVVGLDFTDQAVADSNRLLKHEQTHFALTCALAKKANAALSGKTVAQVSGKVFPKQTALQAKYDNETAHGCDPAAQASWEADIEGGLPTLSLFST